MRKTIIELTLFQSIFIAAWLFTRTAPWFFAALGVSLLASAGVTIYLLIGWRQLPGADRREGVFAMMGWLLLAYIMIHANGLNIGSLWV